VANAKEFEFDKVICTLPSPLFVKITSGFGQNYIDSLLKLEGIGAVNLILSLNKKYLEDNIYWLSINAIHFPFLALVEHTNFIDKKYYGGEHILYIGNYLPHEHGYYKKEAVDLIKEFYPYLKTINPKFDETWINSVYLFKAPFAQPIIPLNYSKELPSLKTPIKGLYLANIQQVYPWDRGTNYAVELGNKVADLVVSGQ
jgi:protoporphyrinogen oxidase